MLLKKIKIRGFKSFVDTTEIDISSSITCVAGPNGSGKSNIVDAIRWVLGEQSIKSLRGASAMSEVIFSGTKKKNPSNVATVSLIFENNNTIQDLPFEIEITRKIYKTGESEYFLNSRKCRLKDINDIFLTSGISKGSYNIISQGEISEFINLSPSERRYMFEDAASVLKYKTRKEEALRKLKRTEDNLLRLNDLIEEISKTLTPLEKSSEKAQKWQSLKKELESLELDLLSTDLQAKNLSINTLKNEIKILEEENLLIDNSLNKLDTVLISLKQEIDNIQKLIKEEKEKLFLKEQEISDLNLKNLLKEKSGDLSYERMLSLQNRLSSIDNRKSLLLTEKQDLISKNEDIIINLKEVNSKYQSVSDDLSKLISEKFKLDATLQGIKDENQDFFPLAKRITSVNIPGVLDIAGRVFVADSIYSIALEVSLGGAKNNIIVENDDAAKRAINYLKQNNLGRLTFLPIESLSSFPLSEDSVYISQGYLGILSNFIQSDQKYSKVKDFLFGRTLLYDTLDNALQGDRRYKRVTLDGETLNKSGVLTGGAVKRGSIYLKEINERLEVLHNTIQLKEQERAQISSLKDSLSNDYYKIQGRLTSLNAEISESDNNYNELSRELALFDKTNVDDVLANLYKAKNEKDTLLTNISVFEKNLDQLNQEYDQNEALRLEERYKLKDNTSVLNDKKLELAKVEIEIDASLEKLLEYKMTYEYLVDNYELRIDIDDARNKLYQLKYQIDSLGPINIGAIEEAARIKERFDFLITEEEDMLSTKAKLLDIIESLDKVMEKEFLDTFTLVNNEFQRVFSEMFNGGEASLKLTDPTNVLESGIEIYAMPVGKNLSTINLLSGGEKSLTGISLIFALLNITPTPFCVFDEVEAALDDVNVDRFISYLSKYQKSQFILVTHKQRTMEYADVLYGVTMKEEGISKLVSLELKDYEE